VPEFLTRSKAWRAAAFAAALLLPATAADAAPRNILLIIADDFGVDVAEFYPTSVREVTTPPAPPRSSRWSTGAQAVRQERGFCPTACSFPRSGRRPQPVDHALLLGHDVDLARLVLAKAQVDPVVRRADKPAQGDPGPAPEQA
jgi:hypothetical protein